MSAEYIAVKKLIFFPKVILLPISAGSVVGRYILNAFHLWFLLSILQLPQISKCFEW